MNQNTGRCIIMALHGLLEKYQYGTPTTLPSYELCYSLRSEGACKIHNNGSKYLS